MTFPDKVTKESIGLLVLLFGGDNYGAMAPDARLVGTRQAVVERALRFPYAPPLTPTERGPMARRTSVIAAVARSRRAPARPSPRGSSGADVGGAARGGRRPTGLGRPAAGPGFSISRDDGNDTQGALDLRSMKITRGGTKDTIVFTNDTAVSNTDIDPDNGNFAVLIDTNDDRTFDFGQYVYFYAGKLRGVLVNLATNRVVDRTAPTSRVNTRTFRTVIQRSKIHSPGTYRFAVFSYSQAAPCTRKNACVDAIPNRYPLIPLDHEAPSVKVTNLDAYANDASGTPDDRRSTSPSPTTRSAPA